MLGTPKSKGRYYSRPLLRIRFVKSAPHRSLLSIHSLRLRRAVSTRKSRRGPQFWSRNLGIGRWRALRRLCRRRARLFRQRLALDQHAHFVGVQLFAFKPALCTALHPRPIAVLDVFW